MKRQDQNLLFVPFLLLITLMAGCLSVDYSPIEGKPFYRKTLSALSHSVRPVGLPGETPQLFAGSARVEITPSPGVSLAGYSKRGEKRAEGVHDPLYARALVLHDGIETIALLSIDALAITDDIFKAVFEKISRDVPIRPGQLVISATHTHSGPGGMGKKVWESFSAGPFDPDLFEEITEKMAEAVRLAHKRMRPSRMANGSARAGDLVANRLDPEGVVDPEIGFIVVRSLDGHATTYLVNYSAHATVLKSDNLLISGDFPGALERRLEEEGGTIALYTAGAVGDQTAAPPPGESNFDRAQKMGRLLAERVLQAARNLDYTERVRLTALRAEVLLPPLQVRVSRSRRLPSFLGRIFFDQTSSVSLLLVGDTLLMGVPCDLSAEIGLALKALAREKGYRGLIVGFANDYIGYVIPRRYYEKRGYEAFMSFNGPHMNQYLQDVMAGLIRQVGVAR